jgi:hypothetical protein
METYQVVLASVGGVLGLEFLIVLLLGGGSLARLGLAWQAFAKVLGNAKVAEGVRLALKPPPPKPPKLSGEPVRLLALLRESRLLDFLLEDVSGAPDDTLGAGVREVHKKAQAVLKERLVLEPVLPQREEDAVTVPAGFDPSAIQVTGNVTGNPPFKGTLRHHGWRVKSYNLPPPPAGQDDLVVVPAEVEIPG